MHDAAAQDVEVMRGPGGRFGLGLSADPGSFDCGVHDRGGVTVERTCTFLDENGVEQGAYDAETTASVVVHAEVRGTFDREFFSGEVDRTNDVTVTGLLGAETEITWNGQGDGTMTRIRQTRDGGEAQFDMTSAQTVTDLVIPVPRTEDGWPLGGTLTMVVSVTVTGGPEGDATRERDVTIQFDGTQFALVTVNGEEMVVDLANRSHAGPGHRGGRRGSHR